MERREKKKDRIIFSRTNDREDCISVGASVTCTLLAFVRTRKAVQSSSVSKESTNPSSRKADNRKVNEIYGYSTSIPSILWVDGEWRKDDDGIHNFSTEVFQRIIFQVFFEKINSPEKIIAPLLHSRIGEEIARRFQKLHFLSPKKIGINETRWDRCVLGGNWNRTGALLELEEVWYACKHAQPCVQGRCMCLVH